MNSITDNTTGDYTVNFSTALVDGNYSVPGTGGSGGAGETSGRAQPQGTASATSSSYRVLYVGAAYYDPIQLFLAFFR